ncbi:hypothetical protein GIB67_005460 [Kingdonia uniflora]|uniref:BZIP domain-containing protein n=1 Tax=Kingdonia uniflora TaxID=39325 RepID=A0A7J7NI71_9MAGN|nr:hypothetical protein GIB67_005460 [Kingdonia uniflora]
MGSREERMHTKAKALIPTASTQVLPTLNSNIDHARDYLQERPPASLYPNWGTPIQAYYGGTTPSSFFTSTTASPSPHPYMWRGQQIIQPYGATLPYPTYYHHGGLYPHPNMNMSQSQDAGLRTTELEVKGSNEKDGALMKKPKGSLETTAVVGGLSIENGKAASGSGNDGASDSAESGSEASSYASDENMDQQEISAMKKRCFSQMHADGANAPNNNTAVNTQVSERGNLVGTNPVANVPSRERSNAFGSPPAAAPATMAGREGVEHKHMWGQDEREMRKQRRKLSNRESARRSRLRKQAECEELQVKVDKLGNENANLCKELRRLAEESRNLYTENASLTVRHLTSFAFQCIYLGQISIVPPNGLRIIQGTIATDFVVPKEEREPIIITEFGSISAVDVSDGIKGSYHLQFITLEPNSLFLPVLLHADMLFYVHSGSGSLSFYDEEAKNQINVQKGDVFRLPAGIVFYLQSSLESTRAKLRIYAIFTYPVIETPQMFTGAYSSLTDLVLGFDKEVLEAAFKVPTEVIDEIKRTRKPPAIIHVESKNETEGQLDWKVGIFEALIGRGGGSSSYELKNKNKKTKTFNILNRKPDFQNCNGWSTTVNRKDLHALKGSTIGVFMVNLTQGSMMGPHWNPRASEIAIVTHGEGMIRVVCSGTASSTESTCKNMSFKVKEGDVFVVPRFHPMAQISYNNDTFVFVGFSTMARKNYPQYLAGKSSVLTTLEKNILAMAFNVQNTTIDQLISSQAESIILECVSCADKEEMRMEEEIETARQGEEKRKREEEEARRREEEEKRRREEQARKREEEEKQEQEEAARREEEAKRQEKQRQEEEEARKHEEEGGGETQGETEEEMAKKQEEERQEKQRQEEKEEEEGGGEKQGEREGEKAERQEEERQEKQKEEEGGGGGKGRKSLKHIFIF